MNPNLILPITESVIPNFIYQNTPDSFEDAQMCDACYADN